MNSLNLLRVYSKFRFNLPVLRPRLCCNFSTKIKEEIDNEGPIKYSQSPASRWKAQDSRTGGQKPRLWYEPLVVGISIAVFIVYFTLLREENQLDTDLGRSLYSTIQGLEEAQLLASLEHNKKEGLSTTAIELRLKELEKEKHL